MPRNRLAIRRESPKKIFCPYHKFTIAFLGLVILFRIFTNNECSGTCIILVNFKTCNNFTYFVFTFVVRLQYSHDLPHQYSFSRTWNIFSEHCARTTLRQYLIFPHFTPAPQPDIIQHTNISNVISNMHSRTWNIFPNVAPPSNWHTIYHHHCSTQPHRY